MKWSILAALAAIVGAGTATQASAQDFRSRAPYFPGTPSTGRPGFVPTRPDSCGTLSPRELERRIAYTLRHRYGHCIDDVDVDVDGRRNCVDVDLEVRHPVPHWQVMQLLYSMPELRGYHVHLRIERD